MRRQSCLLWSAAHYWRTRLSVRGGQGKEGAIPGERGSGGDSCVYIYSRTVFGNRASYVCVDPDGDCLCGEGGIRSLGVERWKKWEKGRENAYFEPRCRNAPPPCCVFSRGANGEMMRLGELFPLRLRRRDLEVRGNAAIRW